MRIGVNALFLLLGRYGGLETYLRALLHAMPAQAPESDFVLFTERTNLGSFADDGVPNLREVLCRAPILRNRKARWATRIAYEYGFLSRRACSERLDVLFSPCFTAPAHPRYASVVTIPDMQQEDHPEYFSTIERRIFLPLMRQAARNAAHILTISEYAKTRIVATYDVSEARVTVTPLAADARFSIGVPATEMMRAQQAHGIRAPYILSVATLHRHKNLDLLIDAFRALRESGEHAMHLVLVGLSGTATEQLRTRIGAEGLGEVIRITGFVPDADLPALYQGASVFVLPSRYEGFGIPVLEAMASGTPVITTTATSLPEVAGDAAVLIDPDDTAGLVAALHRIVADQAYRTELIGRGRERATTFSWERTAALTLAALQAADANRRARSR
jgi:glycosyltransferase involved in cell wall biosynthesis